MNGQNERRTVEDCVSRAVARRVHHFALYSELARWVVADDTPGSVGTEIRDQEFGASGDGHDVVRVRALLTLRVWAAAFELQQRGLEVLREVWRRDRHRSSQDGSRRVLAMRDPVSIFFAQGWRCLRTFPTKRVSVVASKDAGSAPPLDIRPTTAAFPSSLNLSAIMMP